MTRWMRENCYRFVIQDTANLSDIYATLMSRSCEGRSRRAVNVNTTDHTGQTPLHYAVRTAHFEAVRKLCELGANPNQRAHWQGLTPLHLAAVVGSTNIINELLKAGGDPDLKQSRGESARDLLSLFHKIEIPMFSRIKM